MEHSDRYITALILLIFFITGIIVLITYIFLEKSLKNSKKAAKLLKLPLKEEGIYYRETGRTEVKRDFGNGERNIMSTGYLMVKDKTIIPLQRLKSDMVFHYCWGNCAEILLLFPDGEFEIMVLGKDINEGESPQVIVSAGVWYGVKKGNGFSDFSLMGTTISPGFDNKDVEMGKREELFKSYPLLDELIMEYTKS